MLASNTALMAALIALIGLLALAFHKLQKRSGLDRLTPRWPSRHAQEESGEDYVEEQTRFVESAKKKTYRLLNTSEQALYSRLVEAMPNMIVLAQVGIVQLAQLRGRVAAHEIQPMLGRSVDFLVCARDFAIVAGIELIWPTDEHAELKSATEAKQLMLEKLGIPLIYFRPHQIPGVDEIALEIAAALVRRKQLEAARDRVVSTH